MRAGGKSLHAQSHGKVFLSLFTNRFEQGIYLLDDPEAALSPQRQLSLLRIIHDLERPGRAQFPIATHAFIILSYPGAVLLSLDGDSIREIAYRKAEQYIVTRDLLNAPERLFKHLFGRPDDEPGDVRRGVDAAPTRGGEKPAFLAARDRPAQPSADRPAARECSQSKKLAA